MIIFIERSFDGVDIREYFYDTVDLHSGSHFFSNIVVSGADYWPSDGTIIAAVCEDGYLTKYIYDTSNPPGETFEPHFQEYYLTTIGPFLSSSCCTESASDFTIQKTNNSNAILPNGAIDITSSIHDIGDYEVSLDGVTYGSLPLTGLDGAAYTVYLRKTGTPCIVTFSVTIANIYGALALEFQLLQTPSEFVPVFLPITYQFSFIGNTFTIRNDGRTYIDAGSNADLKTFLSTLPYIRIVGSTNYNGNVRVTDVDNEVTPTKFYISPITYVSDESVYFIPIDKQVFQLYGETASNVFAKIADISIAADTDGIFTLRCEGFLQSLFEVDIPANGDDISLGRKFYCIPRDYDLFLGSDETNPILTAVYATVDISDYNETLVPLGSSPINFIDPEGNGYPTIFSYLNQDNQRVTNVRSGETNDFVTSSDSISFQGLPGNIYILQWISADPFDPYFSPSLPDWITIIEQTSNSIKLQIETFTGGDIGDYGTDDYSPLDYSIDQLNAIVGCYTFQMFDGIPSSDEEPIFTFTICIFPTQLVQSICGPNLFNIAWVNQEGGWNSYIFKGQKKHGRDISKVSTYKKLHELKKSSVEEVYDQVEVGFSMKNIEEIAFITMLRTSIQAYLFNDDSKDWDIPIVIEKSNFPTYQTPFRQGDQQGSFIFKYATEVLIQRQ